MEGKWEEVAKEIFDDETKGKIFIAGLDALRGKERTSPMSLTELLQKVQKSVPNVTPDYIYYQTLKEGAYDPRSPIQSTGRGRGGGYYYDDSQVIEDKKTATAPTTKDDKLEESLWAPMALWLLTNKSSNSKYRTFRVSSEVANMKKGGKWGNPDVVGIATLKMFDFFDVEITTIEVKRSLDGWRQWFFEAVSHKRFAERVFFAFYEPNYEPDELNSLLSYAEKFGVGILHLDIEEEDRNKLKDWKKMSSVEQANIAEGVVQFFPAKFEAVELSEKCDFLERLGINSMQELYNFGK